MKNEIFSPFGVLFLDTIRAKTLILHTTDLMKYVKPFIVKLNDIRLIK